MSDYVKNFQTPTMTYREHLRAIELAVDGLNTKAFRQRPETQAVLDRIKQHCRDALR